MGRYSSVKPDWETKRELDKAYTLLVYAERALEACGDDYNASKIQGMIWEYSGKGAVARYEYAPMN